MKIAIISDIHANLPALQATLKSIEAQQPDAVYCLGDLVGYNIWPNEVVDAIRDKGIATLAGNHDAKAKKIRNAVDGDSSSYAYKIIGDSQLRYLATLPAHIRLEFKPNNMPLTILMVHGSPYSNKEYLLSDKDETEFINIFNATGCHVLLCGHSHKPYHRVLEYSSTNGTQYFHAINAGSVGKPKDGDPRACYVILTLDNDKDSYSKDAITTDFIRVDYDIEMAATAVEGSPLPNEFADMLRKAY